MKEQKQRGQWVPGLYFSYDWGCCAELTLGKATLKSRANRLLVSEGRCGPNGEQKTEP